MFSAISVDELRQRLIAVEADNALLRAQIVELRALNEQLRALLDQDSRNSSKPPSTDSPFGKTPIPKPLRGKSGRRPGGQPGHPGATLRQVQDPDEIVVHEPVVCSCCGQDLAQAPVSSVLRRQLFDIPRSRSK